MVVVVCGGQGIFNSMDVHVILLRNACFFSNSLTDYTLLRVEGNFIFNTDGTV